MDIRSLSNMELKEELLKHGVNPGPILPSTRGVYEKKLQQLLEMKVQENGDAHEDQYSDSDDEGAQFKGPVGFEVNGDGGEGAVLNNYIQTKPEDAVSDDLSELLSQSALGMSATRRKPIKGAAGRPIQFQYDDIVKRARMKEQAKETLEEKKSQRLVSVPLQITIFVLVAFIVLVFLSMESSPQNPFEPPTEKETKLQQP